MKSKINKILGDIKLKKEELLIEYGKAKEKYGFKIEWKKIIWNYWKENELKKYKKTILESIFTARILEIVSIPFIYMMFIPAFLLDIFLIIYQYTALKLYKIPLVKRNDYIIFNRKELAYLNLIQKVNCLYCSYINWLFQYAVEIAGRTEKYWCPIKNIGKKHWTHDWEEHFADYWDVEWFKKTFCSLKEFEKKEK